MWATTSTRLRLPSSLVQNRRWTLPVTATISPLSACADAAIGIPDSHGNDIGPGTICLNAGRHQ